MLSNRSLVKMLNIFDVFGFNSGFSILSRIRHIPFIINTIHISVAVFFTYHELDYLPIFLNYHKYTEIFNEIFSYSAPLILYWLTIFDSILHQKTHKSFWDIFHRIDQQFYSQSYFTFKCYKIKLYEFFVVTLTASIIMLLSFSFDYSYNVLVFICEFRVFYYIFCLEIMHFQLKILQKCIHTYKRNSLSEPFKWIRQYFFCNYKMVEHMNKLFGWSHVAAVLFCAHLILSDMTWFYMIYEECNYIQSLGEIRYYSILSKMMNITSNEPLKIFCRFHNMDVTFSTTDILFIQYSE